MMLHTVRHPCTIHAPIIPRLCSIPCVPHFSLRPKNLSWIWVYHSPKNESTVHVSFLQWMMRIFHKRMRQWCVVAEFTCLGIVSVKFVEQAVTKPSLVHSKKSNLRFLGHVFLHSRQQLIGKVLLGVVLKMFGNHDGTFLQKTSIFRNGLYAACTAPSFCAARRDHSRSKKRVACFSAFQILSNSRNKAAVINCLFTV